MFSCTDFPYHFDATLLGQENGSSSPPPPPLPPHFLSPIDHEGFNDLLRVIHLLPSNTTSPPSPSPPPPSEPSTNKTTDASTPCSKNQPCTGARKRTLRRDRHSKIVTAKGPRDRRMRLSLDVAKKFFDLQDVLGFDKASKTVEWLLTKSKDAIKSLTMCSRSERRGSSSGGGGGNAKMESSTSECEVDSASPDNNKEDKPSGIELPTEAPGEVRATGKAKRATAARPPRKAVSHPVDKESRVKARERARERTREKRMRTNTTTTTTTTNTRFEDDGIQPKQLLIDEVEEARIHMPNHCKRSSIEEGGGEPLPMMICEPAGWGISTSDYNYNSSVAVNNNGDPFSLFQYWNLHSSLSVVEEQRGNNTTDVHFQTRAWDGFNSHGSL